MQKTIRIVHLEDLEEDAYLINHTLKKSGMAYELLWVTNKKDYENALDEFNPDIVLSDHSLPSLTSYDALKLLKSKGIKIPFILITATISEEYVISLVGEGINDYILKDRIQRLPGAVLNAIEKADAERDKEKYYNEVGKQERRFRALVENISEAIVIINSEGLITYQTPSATRISGYEYNEAIGSNVFSFFDDSEKRDATQTLKTSFLKPGSPIHQTYRIKHKSGKRIWVEGTITNLLHEESVNGYIINYRDITQRKLTEELIKKSEANLRTIFNNATVGYILMDRNSSIVSYNQAAMSVFDFFGQTPLKEGRNLAECFVDEQKENIKDCCRLTVKGQKIAYDASYIRDNNVVNWYSKSFLPVFGESQQVLGFILSVEDITARKTAEIEREKLTADLIQHNKDLEQFAYIISHNLRSPVANIIGLSNMIQGYPSMSKADFNRCMEGLVSSVKRLDDIIIDLNHILQVRRAIDERKQHVRFSAMVKDVKDSISNLVEKEKITIKTDFIRANELFTIKSYLNSIFYNLISNSIKYRSTDRPSIIEISSRKTPKGLSLVFKDNGLGIDLTLNENKIFGLYKKFHNHIEGKGMGLYMVKTQVEILGGKIGITSEVDRGTEITIEFFNEEK